MVLCGAGMDARAYRLPELAGRRVFELDVKPVLEYKAGVLAEVREGCAVSWPAFQSIDRSIDGDHTTKNKKK